MKNNKIIQINARHKNNAIEYNLFLTNKSHFLLNKLTLNNK